MAKNCENCYYSRSPTDELECHNNPPVFMNIAETSYDIDFTAFKGFFPFVSYDSWCGCWKAKNSIATCGECIWWKKLPYDGTTEGNCYRDARRNRYANDKVCINAEPKDEL